MFGRRVMFCDVICFVVLTGLPIDVIMALFDAVVDPVKTHVHCAGFALAHIIIYDTVSCGIVCFKGRACCGLFVSQLD